MNSFADQLAARRSQILKHVATAVASSPSSQQGTSADSNRSTTAIAIGNDVQQHQSLPSSVAPNDTTNGGDARPDWLDSFGSSDSPPAETTASTTVGTLDRSTKSAVSNQPAPVDGLGSDGDEVLVVEVTDTTPAILVESSEMDDQDDDETEAVGAATSKENEDGDTLESVKESMAAEETMSVGAASLAGTSIEQQAEGDDRVIFEVNTNDVIDEEQEKDVMALRGTLPTDGNDELATNVPVPSASHPGDTAHVEEESEGNGHAAASVESIIVVQNTSTNGLASTTGAKDADLLGVMPPQETTAAAALVETVVGTNGKEGDDSSLPLGVSSLPEEVADVESIAAAAHAPNTGLDDDLLMLGISSEATQSDGAAPGNTDDLVAMSSPEEESAETADSGASKMGHDDLLGMESPPQESKGSIPAVDESFGEDLGVVEEHMAAEESSVSVLQTNTDRNLLPAIPSSGDVATGSLSPMSDESLGGTTTLTETVEQGALVGAIKESSEAQVSDESATANDDVLCEEDAPVRAEQSEQKNVTYEQEAGDLATSAHSEKSTSTHQRESTLIMPKDTIVAVPAEPASIESSGDTEKDVMLVELQTSLQEQMSVRAEAENRARQAEELAKRQNEQLSAKANVELELEKANAALSLKTSEKTSLEAELEKLRLARDEHERKEILLSNRLNAAKKKEAAKANAAETLEDQVKALQTELEDTKRQLAQTQTSKLQASEEAQLTNSEVTERYKQTETALSDERRLNEERKKKMKAFIEAKQEELRQAKAHSEEMEQELEQTNRLLREHSTRWKQLHAQWVQSQTRNRELQRDLNHIKKDSDNLHKIGGKMEMKMAQSAQETEEHKNKRLTAKHELMTMLRTLEAEKDVSTKLRDSIKFTFTPKALSQQQLLRESLQDFDVELEKMSRRLGRPLPPSAGPMEPFSDDSPSESREVGESASTNNNVEGSDNDENGKERNRNESTHLLSNLEEETQRVSKCIMALTTSIERMRALLDESGDRTCVTVLTDLLGASGVHLRDAQASREEAVSMTSASSAPRLSLGSRRYGQLPTSGT